MPSSRQPLLRSLFTALLLFLALPAMENAVAQGASMPSPIEHEFWTSTRQIDTVPAYQAYLNKFPNGFFASLAVAAIRKGDNSPAEASSRKPAPPEARGDSTANKASAAFSPARIAGPTKSSAITQQVGEVFNGPGPITVGWLGAKKQIVVPRGQWVLLAAEDSLSTHTHAMAVTALVLAELEGSTVRSLLLARFNSKAGNSTNTWNDARLCETPPASAPFAWSEPGYSVTQCVKSALLTQTNSAKTLSGSIWTDALRTLAAGGGDLPRSPYLLTEMFYTGDSSNYLKLSRIDFGVAAGENALGAQASAFDLSLAACEKWAKVYSPLAAAGYRKKLSEDELYAGSPATISLGVLPE